MSTRANIGIMLDDGVILSVYVHHDGYPEHILGVVKTTLKDKVSVLKFLAGGDCSSIYNHYDYESGTTKIDATYYRDESSMMKVDKDMDEYKANIKDSWYEFCYLWMDGKWMYSHVDTDKDVNDVVNFVEPDNEEM